MAINKIDLHSIDGSFRNGLLQIENGLFSNKTLRTTDWSDIEQEIRLSGMASFLGRCSEVAQSINLIQ